MFNIFFTNFIINQNIIKVNLSKVVKIFKENVVHVILIINKLIHKIKKQNIIFVNFYKNNKNN